jgi:hypothetical protein
VTAVAVLAVSGSVQPYAIIGTSILATTFSTIAGISPVKLLEKLPGYRLSPLPESGSSGRESAQTPSEDDQSRLTSAATGEMQGEPESAA